MSAIDSNSLEPRKNIRLSKDASINFTTQLQNLDEDEEGEGGSTGIGGQSGFIEPVFPLGEISTAILREIREGERQYGIPPYTQEEIKRSPGNQLGGDRLRRHPLLTETQQFSGISDAALNAAPPENPNAQRNQELRLQAQLQQKHQQQYTQTPTLKHT